MSNPHSAANAELLATMELCGHFLYHRRGGKMSQERILRILSDWEAQHPAPAAGLSQSELQTILGVRSGTISETIGKLESGGLIQKTRQENDRRKVCLMLTEAGRSALQQLPRENSRQEALLFADLSPQEQQTLLVLLDKLLKSWETNFDPALLEGHRTPYRSRLHQNTVPQPEERSESCSNT